MPQDAIVELMPGTLPEGVCYQAEQQRLNGFVEAITASLPGSYSTFVMSASVPSVEDEDKPWIKLDSSGNIEGIYTHDGSFGAWVRPNPAAPSSSERRLWVGTEAALWAYDGGSGDDPALVPPTDAGGAMWEVDDGFENRVPIGAGTLAAATNAARFESAAPSATPEARGVYFIKRTARIYVRGT